MISFPEPQRNVQRALDTGMQDVSVHTLPCKWKTKMSEDFRNMELIAAVGHNGKAMEI